MAVSVVVFTAVNWSQLDASVQGLILVALTIAAGVAATAAARRDMPSTGEALGIVAVLLALADVHAFHVGLAPGADGFLFWAGGFGLVALLAAALGRANAIRSPQIAAGLLGQLPLLCVLQAADAAIWAAQLAVAAQALVVLAAADHLDGPRWARRVAAGWALVVASILTAGTVLDSMLGDLFTDGPFDAHRAATGACLAAAAVLALAVAWLRRGSEHVRLLGTTVATALGLGGVWFATVDAVGSETAVGIVALAGALVLFGSRRLPGSWGDGPAVMAGLIGSVAVLPLLGAMASMLVAASNVSTAAWARSGSTVAAHLQLADAHDYGALGLALQLVALAIGAAALVRRGSGTALATSAAVLALAALVVSPLLAPLSIAATAGVALAAAVLGAVVAVAVGGRSPVFRVAAAFAALAWCWALPWSLATPGLTFATLSTGIAGALVVAAVARRDGVTAVAVSGAVWVAGATPLLAGLVAWDQGVGDAMAWAVASVAAAVVSVVGVTLLDPKGTAAEPSRRLREAVELTSLVAYLAALVGAVCLADADAASVALAGGVLGFGLHAVRPGRLLCGSVAAVQLLALVWLRLGRADVALVEAYTLPLAVALLAAGLIGARLDRGEGGDPGSWITYGPALVVGLAPTTWLAFTQPGTIRPLVGLVAGALVLVAGALWGKRAFVDVGTATVVALGLRQLVPVVGEIPNWATIGATGILLLAVGATFEQRRRDVRAVLRRYSALT